MHARIATGLVTLLLGIPALALGDGPWIGTWQSSPVGVPTETAIGSIVVPAPGTVRGTVRYRLRLSQGGRQLRLRLSNEYGETPLVLQAVSVGLASDATADAQPGSLRTVTFGGRVSITIPAHSPVLSDAVDLPVRSLADIVVSVHVPAGLAVFSWAAAGSATDPQVVDRVDATLLERWPASRRVPMRPLVSAVDVQVDRPRKVVVAFGDSLTEGALDPATGEHGWPGALSRRLRGQGTSVVNAGIGGNRLLQSTSFMGASLLARLDQDVFSVPGLTHIVLLAGINDIGMSGPDSLYGNTPLVSASEMIAAFGQVVARAHERGVKVIGATLLPFEGAITYTAEKEAIRAAVNAWIRTAGAFDGVIDFDATIRDPLHPGRVSPPYDLGDHIHLNAAGYRAMGESIDLHLLR